LARAACCARSALVTMKAPAVPPGPQVAHIQRRSGDEMYGDAVTCSTVIRPCLRLAAFG
jgi:hypothetical protein